jgi:arylsulfatase A-like enzyme/Flp pilus assembly protein TadD
MTGLDPPDHGVRHNSVYRLPDGVPTLSEHLGDAGYATAAFIGSVVLDRRFGLTRGFQVYDDRMSGRRSGTVGYAERRADDVVAAALEWLEDAPDRFFAWVHFYDPHAHYDPPPGFASAFASRPYEGEIAFVDAELGRLLAGVRERWGDESLLVVATSDHGESFGDHGELTHSYRIYDSTQRVPLLMQGPGLPAGHVVKAPVRLIDVAPTLLRMAGAAPLENARGRDLVPVIRGDESNPPAAYMETVATQLDMGWSPLLGVRTARYKYIRPPRPELYDLQADPEEAVNRAGEDPTRVAMLDAELEARLRSASKAAAPAPELSDAERDRLRSLGYLVPTDRPDDREVGVVAGPDPKDYVGLLRSVAVAQRRMNEGKPEEALAELEGVEDPGATIAGLRAVAALMAGRFEESESAARAGIEADPNRSDIVVVLGRALEFQGRHAEARIAFDSALEIDPGSIYAMTGLGRQLEHAGETDRAQQSYRGAWDAGDAEAGWRLAALLIEDGHVEEARGIEEELPVEARTDPAAVLRLAGAETTSGLEEQGAARVKAAWAGNPDEPRLAVAMASLHLAREEPAEALALLDSIQPSTHFDLRVSHALLRARALKALGRTEAARRTLDEALAGEEKSRAPWLDEARALRSELQ